MVSYQKFIKNIGIVGLTNFLIFLERIILLPVITKFLGAENYGIWTQLGVTISLITPLALLGLPAALIRFLSAEKEKKKIQEGIYSAFFLVLGLSLIVALLLIIFASPIANFFQSPLILIKILALIILFESLDLVLLNLFPIFQEISKYAFFVLLKTFGEVGLVIGAVLFNYGLKGAVLSLFLIRIIFFFILLAFIFKKIGIKIPAFSPIKEYLRFGLPTLVSNFSYWLVTSSDRYLIGFFLGIIFVGYYAPAYTIGNILNFLIYPLAFILPLVLSKLFDENKISEVRIYLQYSLKYFLMIALPSVFGLSLLSRQLLTIFSTPEIASQSYYIVPFVASSIFFYGIYAILAQVILLFKKTKIAGAIWLGAALLNLGLNFIFIPLFGILGAALTTFLAYILALFLTWHFAFKDFQFKIDWQFISKILLSSVLMALFLVWFQPIGLIRTILAIILAALFYGIFIFLLKGFNREEIEFLKSFLRNSFPS